MVHSITQNSFENITFFMEFRNIKMDELGLEQNNSR